jgi:hypothetical protein
MEPIFQLAFPKPACPTRRPGAVGLSLTGKSEMPQFPCQRLSMNAEYDGGTSDILIVSFEHAENVVFLQLGQRHQAAGPGRDRQGGGLYARREIFRKDDRLRSQRNRSFHRVF